MLEYREDQKPIMEYVEGSMAVPAVPGAGKTFIITHLVTKLIEEGRHKPGKVLIVTYMNSAANNFKGRISKILQEKECRETSAFEVMTIHSLAVKIIKEKPEVLLANDDFRVLEDSRKIIYMNDCIRQWRDQGGERIFQWFLKDTNKGVEWEERFIGVVNSMISELKYHHISPEMLEQHCRNDSAYRGLLRCIAPIYKDYTARLRMDGLLDYDDLLVLSYRALSMDTSLREKMQKRYAYIFEDECQDSNLLQGKILSLLSKSSGNLVRVGDVNQSISGTFTSSNPKFFRYFCRDAERLHKMDMAGRSSKDIIELANYLVYYVRNLMPEIRCREALEDLYIRPVPDGGAYKGNPKPEQYCIYTGLAKKWENEVEKTVATICNFKKKFPEKSIGILVPTNQQIEAVAEKLREKDLDCEELTPSNAASRRILNLVGSILAFSAEPDKHENLFYLIEFFLAEGDNKEKEELYRFLLQFSVESLLYPQEGVTHTEELTESLSHTALWKRFLDIIPLLRDLLEKRKGALYEYVLYIGNFLQLDEKDKAMIEFIAAYIQYHCRNTPNITTREIAGRLRDEKSKDFYLISETIYESQGYEPSPGSITVCTYHKAKGMEWDCVFLLDLTAYKFPDSVAKTTQGEIWYLKDAWRNPAVLGKADIETIFNGVKEEEPVIKSKIAYIEERIRLLYVGITRAREHLFLMTHTEKPNGRIEEISQFYQVLNQFILSKGGKQYQWI